jgi:hypothetical protein
VGQATFHTDGSVDASIFVGAVPPAPPPGGVVIIHPPASAALGVKEAGDAVSIDTLGDHPLARGLDLSGLTLPGVPAVDLPAWATPVLVADGRVLAYAGRWEDSPTLVLLVDPDAGGLDRRLAFPLLVARAIEAVAGPPPAAVVPAGAAVRSPPGSGWRLVGPGGRTVAAPGTADDTGQPGLYDFAADRAPAGDWRFGVLAGDAQESDLSAAPLGGGAAPPGPALGLAGLPWWPFLAGLALGLILLELALRLAAAPRRPAPGVAG